MVIYSTDAGAFEIIDTKLYTTVVTLLTQDFIKATRTTELWTKKNNQQKKISIKSFKEVTKPFFRLID